MPPAPLSETDANRPAGKPPASRSRKRKSDATDGDAGAAATAATAEPAPKKKKTTKKVDDVGPLPDLSGIYLDGDEDMSVRIYDTCEDVRTKIRRLLRRGGVTKAAFLRTLVKAAYPPGSTHKIASNLLDNFLKKKGPVAGNTSSVFYAAYVFFEKLRIRDEKPKTQKREEMEDEWPLGFETREQLDRCSYIVGAGSEVALNEYGRAVSFRPRGRGFF
ncbi:uncharacterized protein GLRG_04108 [Colletotrichum graminicola M1.001]|uniref:DUF7726 domain-containing protein n=1 Tax=Colletotrichum graminicola (strain M1.001 / M2 / FGSC 10212) TaxID=645133 RepID=E3QDM6_COLGM|nr:uncharacterized protein GLRG_04108 [Colletotrichum graminicola M1.001]EFQ28964.1 hypothetical protein GLRG_04108 [Colletotrichum graminicola M1.001]